MKITNTQSLAEDIGFFNGKVKRSFLFVLLVLVMVLIGGCAAEPGTTAPGVTLRLNQNGSPEQVSGGVQLLVLLTVLSIAPAILILSTSFTRIVIVLSMLRSAIGTPTIPPNQVIIGLSLILTFFI